MNDTLPLTVTHTDLIKAHGDSLHVAAFAPQQMQDANAALLQWCRRKIEQLQAEANELAAAAQHALQRKWKASTLRKHHQLALKRVDFYQKIEIALKHGYYIVPNFPVTLFAIRTKAKTPIKGDTSNRYDQHEQPAQLLPAGEGDYKNPFPAIWQTDVATPAEKAAGNKNLRYYAKEFDTMEFPVTMAKPMFMQAVDRAMTLKAFDAFGILPNPKRKADPIIVGRLYDPRARKWERSNRGVTFIIGWYLDTSVL